MRADTFDQVKRGLAEHPRTWLVTGSAGFIGSHLVETLLALGQRVVSLDNFATGHRRNLEEVRDNVGEARWRRHRFLERDIRSLDACREAVAGVDVVLHEAALGSVPRSLADPVATHTANVDGFVNMLVASREAGVRRFVYAGSSSTYGDHAALPKVEATIGRPLSPYAVTKLVNELYAQVFGRCYGMETIGLRYFNVFGARQDPDGPYAAVIPRWIGAMLRGDDVVVNGDGETTRDFCYIDNVVQANLLAATTDNRDAINEVFNVAVGGRTSLNQLFACIRDELARHEPGVAQCKPRHAPFRAGDVPHSQADVGKAAALLGYEPTHTIGDGLRAAMTWYVGRSARAPQPRVAAGD